MSNELLRLIRQFPDVDAPRLAYAAWCDEQPDEATRAHGEFIRGQIAVATGRDTLAAGGPHALQQRIFHLWDRYGATWAAPLRASVDDYSFIRGFVGLVKLSARSFLENAESLFAAAPVQHVDLLAVRDVDERLFASPGLARLRSLSLDRCGLYDFHLRLLAASPTVAQLQWLSLADNHLQLPAAEAIAASPNLKQLRFAEFRGNPVDPCEQLGWDAGIVVSTWLPPEGEALEERYGYLPWLHRGTPVSRFAS